MLKKIWIITLFPEFFAPLVNCGVTGQALRGERGRKIDLECVQLRNFSPKNYKGVDDTPYGGGVGLVMRADVLENALIEGVQKPGGYRDIKKDLHVVFASPRGSVWSNVHARKMAQKFSTNENQKDLVFICGRYEGIDERFIEKYVDEEISLGDFILTGGELATMVIIDTFMRFFEGVLGNKLSSEFESFEDGLLEYPQYTKPQDFQGLMVPEVLTKGNHAHIERYRNEERIRVTKKFRPDLLEKYKDKK